MPIRLVSIHVYPLKSARGLPLTEAELDERGLAGDRRWMVVDERGDFLTQRTLPAMCLIDVEVLPDGLVLRAPEREPLRLAQPADVEAAARRVRVWDDVCDALSAGAEAAAWISAFLGVRAEIVHLPDRARRLVDPRYAPGGRLASGELAEHRVGFADGFPLLLASEASLADLEARIAVASGAPAGLSMQRFRPNLVVSGAAAFEEDTWDEIAVGGVPFAVVKPCSRCSITTVDPERGTRGVEPLATLARYREAGGKVLFGQNLVHLGRGRLRVGDAVEVRRGQAPR